MANFCGSGDAVLRTSQRAVSLALSMAFSIPLTSAVVLAHGPMPGPAMPAGAWQAHSGVAPNFHRTSLNSFQNGQSVQSGQTAGSRGQTLQHALKSLFHNSAAGTGGSGQSGANGGSLNLTSSQLNFLAGNLANFSSLTIDVGGRQEIVGLNTRLSAAEVVAVEQVITGGSASAQAIKIGANGAASGGTISLNSTVLSALDNSLGGSISALTVAKDVQLVDSVGSLDLSGKLTNYGTIQTAAAVSGSTDTIAAGSIFNAAGGAIGSYNGGGNGGGNGGNSLVGADVALSAASTLTNAGTISSTHNLNITAPAVNNTGSISTGSGNINMASNGALNVTGAGTWQANSGNVNFAAANSDINVTGANVLSQQVNFNAGSGNVFASMGQVTGVVNASGNEIEVGANTPVLHTGQIDASGDPLFFNQGTIAIGSVGFNPANTNGAPAVFCLRRKYRQ